MQPSCGRAAYVPSCISSWFSKGNGARYAPNIIRKCSFVSAGNLPGKNPVLLLWYAIYSTNTRLRRPSFMRCTTLSTLCVSLLLAGCHDNKGEDSKTAYGEQQKQKPLVAVAPVIDNSKHNLTWNISDELTNTICYRLEQKDRVYLVDGQKIRNITRKFQSIQNPFGDDLAWIKKSFPDQEFVVFMELLEHTEEPTKAQKDSVPRETSANLNMSVRLRVVDVRDNAPAIVLQEIIHDTHFIPRQFTQYNFHQVSWGSEDFSISPVGMAHAQLTKEIASRIEEYIALATQVQ